LDFVPEKGELEKGFLQLSKMLCLESELPFVPLY